MVNEIGFVLGVLFLVGAYRRWRWLVDPPDWMPFYSQAGIRRRFGQTFTVYFTYFLGLVFVVAGGIGTYNVYGAQILKFVHASIM
jgi:hypothetical protein